MHEFLLEEKLEKLVRKIYQKDKLLYRALIKKIKEIISCPNLNHYKNLKKPLQDFKRVHIQKSFVLLFKKAENKIVFYDLDHHDNIYKK